MKYYQSELKDEIIVFMFHYFQGKEKLKYSAQGL